MSSPSTPLSGPGDTTQPDHPGWKSPPPRVVVVGAGFAGIAAAGTLREGGVDDVIVLEAQNRPGGRVHTVQLEGGFVDIGAQFIHGESGNSLFELAEKYGLLLDKDLYQHGQTSDSSAEDFRDHPFFTSDGRLLPPEKAAQLLSAINQIFRDYSNSFFHEENKQLSSAHADLKPAPNNILPKQNIENEQSQSDDMIDTDLNRQQETHNTSSTESGWLSEEDCDEEFSEVVMKELTSKDDYIIHYGGATVENDGGKEENTFAEVLRISRERILQVGDEPEEIKLAVLRWMEQWEYTDNAGRLQDLSLQAYGKYGYLPGFGLTLTTSGIEDVFKAFLSDSLPRKSLHLNTPVKTIFWQPAELSAPEENPGKNLKDTSGEEDDGNGTISDRKNPNASHQANGLTGRSHHQNGNDPDPQLSHKPVKLVCGNGEEFWADHVIVTSSMGYLKENEAAMFQPALPEKLRKAVLQMGFGAVAKVFVVWDSLQEVLDPDMEGIQLLWVEGQQVRPPSDRTAPKAKTGGNWYDFLQGFERVKSHKGTLLTWLAGEEAEIMEQLPEEEVKDVLYELLVQFLGRQLPPPKKVVRSVWHDNQYIRGGYSYLPSNMDSRTHDLLSLPLPSTQNPVLQLCGEATSRRFYSSVHGAIDSGRRAARVILRHYR